MHSQVGRQAFEQRVSHAQYITEFFDATEGAVACRPFQAGTPVIVIFRTIDVLQAVLVTPVQGGIDQCLALGLFYTRARQHAIQQRRRCRVYIDQAADIANRDIHSAAFVADAINAAVDWPA